MKKMALLIVSVCAVTVWMQHASVQSKGHDQSKYRLILVFAPNAGNGAFRQQKDILRTASSALHEHDAAIIYMIGGDVSGTSGPKPGPGALALRREYGVPPHEFRVVFIGKNGGVKLISSSPLSVNQLLNAIDAMPAE